MPEFARVHPIRLVSRDPLSHQIQEFLLDRAARGLAKRTVAWYGEQLRLLEAYCQTHGTFDTTEFTPPYLRAMLVDFGKTHNPGGVHGLYRAVRAFLNWYTLEYDLDRNPIDKVDAPRVQEQALEPVSLVDLRKMIAVCERRTFYGDRDRAMLLCLLDSGCRRAEFLALNLGDVDMQSGAVMVRHGKGDKPRVVFFGAKSRKALAAYLRYRSEAGDAQPLWVTQEGERLSATALRALLKRRAREAGVPMPSPHDFRRGFALNTLRAGVDLISVQRLLGHSDLSVIRRYLAQTQEDLQRAHAQGSPVDRLL